MDSAEVGESSRAVPEGGAGASRHITIDARDVDVASGASVYTEIHNFRSTKAELDPAGEYELFSLDAKWLTAFGDARFPELAAAFEGLRQDRLLAIKHADAPQGSCTNALFALLKAAARSGRTLVTASTLDLGRQLAYPEGLQRRGPFLLFFEEGAFEKVDGNLRILTSHAQRGRLREFLDQHDGWVVIPVSAQLRRRREVWKCDWSGFHVLEVEPEAALPRQEAESVLTAAPAGEDDLVRIIRFIAAFMPGLSIGAFDSLASRLLEATQPNLDAMTEAMRQPRRFQRDARSVDLVARWRRAGDEATREAGVVYGPGRFGAGGYEFARSDDAKAVESALIAQRPAWLARQFDLVLAWLFEDTHNSPAKQQGAQRLCIRLEEHGIASLGAERMEALLDRYVLATDAAPHAEGCMRSLLAGLSTAPSTSAKVLEFMQSLAAQCPVVVSGWLDWIERQPETARYLASGTQPTSALLQRRLAEAIDQHGSIRRLVVLQQLLAAALDRIGLEPVLPLLVEATTEADPQRQVCRSAWSDPQLRFFTEPARWCMWSLLVDWLNRSVHLLPAFCIASAKYWRRLESTGATMEKRWQTTVLFEAVRQVLYLKAKAYVYESDVDAGHALEVIFGDAQSEDFDAALGLVIASQSQTPTGDDAEPDRHAPPHDLQTTVNFYGLFVCVLQKRDPARTVATRERVRSLARAVHAALEVRQRRVLSDELKALEEAYRRKKDGSALAAKPERRRIWLSRIDAVRELRNLRTQSA